MKDQLKKFIGSIKINGDSSTILVCSPAIKEQNDLASFIIFEIFNIENINSLENHPDIFKIKKTSKQSIGIGEIHEFNRIGQ